MTGAQTPRIRVVPDGDEHPQWAEMMEVLALLEIELDPWQLDVLHTSLLRRGDVWAAFSVAVCCPRQNGKNEILQARELLGALVLGESLIIHSAHLADTCMEAFTRLDDLIDSSDWLLDQIEFVRRTNGRELIKFRNGARLRFRTRTRGGGRGFSGSPVIFDEPMFLPVISQNAILPVLSAQPDPQAWYTGSAVDQREHVDGLAFARVRESALAGEDDRLAYFEWSLAVESPDALTEAQAVDCASWAETNPALGIRITPEYIRAERGQLTPRGFAVERLGVGDWPDTTGAADRLVDMGLWDELGYDGAVVSERCIAFDVSPERHTTIVSIGMNDADELVVDVLQSEAGTSWVPQSLCEFADEAGVADIVCDGRGPASSVAKLTEETYGLQITRLDSEQHADACGLILDRINQGGLRHRNQDELTEAVRGARTRPLVDRWAWSRRNSRVNIAPLVAATLGVWSAVDKNVGLAATVGIF